MESQSSGSGLAPNHGHVLLTIRSTLVFDDFLNIKYLISSSLSLPHLQLSEIVGECEAFRILSKMDLG